MGIHKFAKGIIGIWHKEGARIINITAVVNLFSVKIHETRNESKQAVFKKWKQFFEKSINSLSDHMMCLQLKYNQMNEKKLPSVYDPFLNCASCMDHPNALRSTVPPLIAKDLPIQIKSLIEEEIRQFDNFDWNCLAPQKPPPQLPRAPSSKVMNLLVSSLPLPFF